MTSFVLKMIAIITMLIDHTGSMLDNHTMRIIGRLAFPIFAFQLAVSCNKTNNRKRFFGRLLLFAIISEIPFLLYSRVGYIEKYGFKEIISFKNNFGPGAMFAKYDYFNILFTMVIASIIIAIYDERYENYFIFNNTFCKIFFDIMKLLLMSAILIVTYIIRVEYSVYGILFILGLYIAVKHGNKLMLFLCTFAFALIEYFNMYRYLVGSYSDNEIVLLFLFTILPVILMIRFNGKRGISLKYLFYIIYPVQFIILVSLKYFGIL